jgi:hypothetical protein
MSAFGGKPDISAARLLRAPPSDQDEIFASMCPMMKIFEFVYYLFWVGVLIGALQHLGNMRFALILWPILIGESVWFFASYLPRRLGWRE